MEQTNKLWESDLKLYGNNNFIVHSFCYLASFFKRRAFPCNHRATFTAKHKVLQIVLTLLYKICRIKKRIQQMKNRKFLPRSVDALSSVFPPQFFFGLARLTSPIRSGYSRLNSSWEKFRLSRAAIKTLVPFFRYTLP